MTKRLSKPRLTERKAQAALRNGKMTVVLVALTALFGACGSIDTDATVKMVAFLNEGNASTGTPNNCTGLTFPKPHPGAVSLLEQDPAGPPEHPGNFRVICSSVDAGNGKKAFGLLLAPVERGTNRVSYNLPNPPAGKRWYELRVTGTIGDLSNLSKCRGKVSFGAIAHTTNPQLSIPALAPVGAVVGTDDWPYKITLQPSYKSIEFIAFSDGDGQVGSGWCDHAFLAEPWLIPGD